MSRVGEIFPEAIRGSYLRKFALIVALTVFVTAATGFYFQQQVSADVTSQTHANMETVSTQQAERLSQWNREQRQRVRVMSGQSVFNDPDAVDIGEELIFIKRDQPDFVTDIYHVDTDSGKILHSTTEELTGTQIVDELEWRGGEGFFLPTDQAVVASQVFRTDGGVKMAFASTTLARSRAVVTVVDVTGLMESFQNPYDGGKIQVVNSQGTIDLADEQSTVLSKYSGGADFEGLRKARNGEAGVIQQDQSGTIVASAAVEGIDWVVLTTVPQQSAYAVRSTVRTNFVILLGISLGSLLFIGLTIGRSTVASLNTLTTKAQELKDGNLDVSVESDRSDEIGELFGAFDTMRSSLKDRIADVNEAREEAEAQRQKAEKQRLQLQEAADRYETTMNNCADGDLTQRLDPDENNESMRKIAEEFNYMIGQIEGTVAQVKQFSENVSEASEIVLSSTSELETASGQIAESAQFITEMTQELQSELDSASTDIDACLDDIEAGNTAEAREKLRDISTIISRLADRTGETLDESEKIAAATEQQTAALTEVSEMAKSLDRSAGPLDDLLNNFECSDDQTFYFGEASGANRVSEEN